MANIELFARLKPYAPRLGLRLRRLHFGGNLYQGGDRPTWYKVTPEMAAKLKQIKQDAGAAAFDIVDADEKKVIDVKEEERRLVALGVMSETVAKPGERTAVDLTVKPEPAVAAPIAREAAIPSRLDVDESSDLSTADLR